MTFLDIKFFGADRNTLFDTEIKKIFAISSVRVSGIKEDNFNISII